MSYEMPFAYAESPREEEDARPWLRDRHHPLLGRHVPPVLVPEWPGILVEPSYQLDRVLPTGFKSYTRYHGTIYTDHGATYDRARWNLQEWISNVA
jgi:hypothetical protein